MTQFSQLSDADFCAAIFDHVRSMSKDHEGVTRQGYRPLESEVLDYLEGIGRDLNLEIAKDAAGNVWMTLPGRDRKLPAVFPAVMPTLFLRAETMTDLRASWPRSR